MSHNSLPKFPFNAMISDGTKEMLTQMIEYTSMLELLFCSRKLLISSNSTFTPPQTQRPPALFLRLRLLYRRCRSRSRKRLG